MTIESNILPQDGTFVADMNELAANQNSATQERDTAQLERDKWTLAEQAIVERLQAHSGPVVVDLDETLYLRNSTEEFIGLAAPGIIAAYLLRLLDLASPWRFIGGHKCRDNWRILLVLVLFPWTYLRWKNHCRNTVPKFINTPLRDALAAHSKHTIIASNGYQMLIRPMLGAFQLPDAVVVCCKLFQLNHRRDGKLALLAKSLDQELIAQSLVITDSYTDADLLRACKTPCLTVWREAVFQRAFDGLVYLPTDYLSKVKRPRQRATRTLVIYDILPWVLVGLSVAPGIGEVLGLIALFLSMWAIYEVGYFDNDQCAVHYEKDPKLTPEAQAFNGRYFKTKAWLTALVLGAIAIALLKPDGFIFWYAVWIATLATLNLSYWFYNRIDKSSRTWLYPVLQLFRFGALFTVVPVTAVAYAVVFSQAFCRWVNYIIYRQQRSAGGAIKWPKTADQAIRLVTCFLLLLPLIITGNWQAFMTPASVCLIIFVYGFRKYDWNTIRTTFHRLDKKPE